MQLLSKGLMQDVGLPPDRLHTSKRSSITDECFRVMIGRRGCISGTSCVTLTLIRSLAGRTIKRFYCLTGLCSHISAILITSMMIVMMIHHTRAIPLLLVLLLLLHHDAFGRHVRGRGRRHVLGHLQGLLDFGRPSWWLLWPIALIL